MIRSKPAQNFLNQPLECKFHYKGRDIVLFSAISPASRTVSLYCVEWIIDTPKSRMLNKSVSKTNFEFQKLIIVSGKCVLTDKELNSISVLSCLSKEDSGGFTCRCEKLVCRCFKLTYSSQMVCLGLLWYFLTSVFIISSG